MKELELKYGCNPNQKPSRIYMENGELPIQVLNGKPGYINFLDAFNGWQLVSELKKATGLPAATSFKHVSPAGAAVGLPLTETLAKIYWVNDMDWKNFSPLACAYARARGADRMSSFGDFISLSDVCDKDTALLIKREVSDGVIAPGYTEEALEILKQKKKGNYNVIQIDENFVPAPLEHKEVFGVTFEQGRQELAIDDQLISNIVTKNKELSEEAKRDMKISLIILKYTQSNSVCYVKDGQAIGVGAGQQFPLFGFGQHRQLCSVHAAQLHFVVHPNAPGLFLFSPGVWDARQPRMRGKNCALSRLAGKRGKILFFVQIYDMLYLRRQRRHQALCPQTQAASPYRYLGAG